MIRRWCAECFYSNTIPFVAFASKHSTSISYGLGHEEMFSKVKTNTNLNKSYAECKSVLNVFIAREFDL